MTIKYHSEARKEFIDQAGDYEDEVVGLGNEFISEVEKVLDLIRQHPLAGTPITSNERRFLVSRFRYGIIYAVEDDRITVFAVMDLRRELNYWKHRR